MILQSLESIVEALNRAGSRYLIAGGLAVNAHGYTRATHDIDLILQLDASNLERALKALADLEYKPLPPVPLRDFADAEKRESWIRDKGLTVFPLASPQHPQAPVDIFVTEPFDFDREYDNALCADLVPGVGLPVRFVALDTLIAMKSAAGRHRDLDDIEHLREIKAFATPDSPHEPTPSGRKP